MEQIIFIVFQEHVGVAAPIQVIIIIQLGVVVFFANLELHVTVLILCVMKEFLVIVL
jgi:hypothetical protein